MTSKLFYYPHNQNYNSYSTSLKSCIEHVEKNTSESLTDFFSFKYFLKPKKIVLNWFEDYPFDGNRLKFKRLLVFVIFVLCFLAPYNQIIWVRHNYSRHNGKGFIRLISLILGKLLSIVASRRVVLSKKFAQKNKSYSYLPHIKYGSFKSTESCSNDLYNFALVGKLEPRKKIATLLEFWPSHLPLYIAGECDYQYREKLESIIESRRLTKVNLDIRCLSIEEYECVLEQAQCILNMHGNSTNIVSGSLIHALSRRKHVICMATEYSKELSMFLPSAITNIHKMEELKTLDFKDKLFSDLDWQVFQEHFGRVNQLKHLEVILSSKKRSVLEGL
ncbi:hypothetical protein [Catenovulum agarivorans]|uniref:hypothetical protein n=1 Tax=Catenovulum agarivorans TaxID=1172192 RepID=UPI00030A2D65|nr:hypothetical protein [Catenovulum agarivorans]